ncbi:putative lipoprotein YbbD precursor [Pseudodesulfovibrio hydrargyri]|uniref:Putative lipoprotein YbbD n=1 Tax=Pseudodesulfovibrio hydrargyri TaxID=2125990 RepID=A0A1J5MX03_9BACT|nr:glycoside hydrolase family 3 protein [Pseudodesulfovibrio hydrargyri]OIQ51054.1 putative lipoprotein YbbD precursor [Pseudodesulfovibrio hydrargyri]
MRIRLAALLLLPLFLLPCPGARAADLDTMIGQMILAGFRGFSVDENSTIMRDIRERHLGGIILFDYDMSLGSGRRNIRTKDQVRKLIADLKANADIPLLVAVDQEGGKVQRLKKTYGFKETPSAAALCASGDAAVRAAGATVGTILSSVGFNLDFAPVADVNVNPGSPAIGRLGRSFSSDPGRVARCDALFMDGLHGAGVLSCLKHFPGHGSAGTDSHKGLTDVTDAWSEAELIPYRELIAGGKVDMIMTAHIFNAHLDPEYPATLSRKVITGLLRGRLGYRGVVVTDDMDMGAIADEYGRREAVRRAVEAGADILLFGNNLAYDEHIVEKVHAVIRSLVDDGTIPEARIEQSYERIMRLKAPLG